MTSWLAICPTCRIPRYGIAFDGDDTGPLDPASNPFADRATCYRCGILIPLTGEATRFTKEI